MNNKLQVLKKTMMIMSVIIVNNTMHADNWPKLGHSRAFETKEQNDLKKAAAQSESTIKYSYDKWINYGSEDMVVSLTEPGTLSDAIPSDLQYTITGLAIKGPLNGTDIRFLREMCGVDINDVATGGKLVSLDLKDAIFVDGGAWYVKAWQNYCFTSDSPDFPSYSFAWLRKLKRIRFPQYCYNLTKGSLLQCQDLSEISLPCGTTLLDSESLNGGYDDMPLTQLWLPSSFSEFKAQIYRCKNLTDIYCFATTPPVVSYPESFKSQTNISNGTLYVPKGCADAYWRAKGWQAFKDIKEVLDIYSTLYVEVGEHGILKYDGKTLRKTNEVFYSGWRAFEVPFEETINMQIIPDEGYQVSKVTLNNVSVDYDSASQSINISKVDNCSKLEIEFSEASNTVQPSEIILSHDEFYMLKGEIRKLTATVLPEDATDKTVTWTSGDESVASVDMSGVVFALDWGTTEITATTSNNLTATCKIVVSPSMVEPTGITLSHDELNMLTGEIMKISATVIPENATDKSVRWTIADESIATIDNEGVVISQKVGTTEITAYTSNDLSAKCLVVVTAPGEVNPTDWAGHYKVTASHVELDATREYPDVFEMDIEKVGEDWFVTSMFGEDLTIYNDGGFRLQDNGNGTASIDIINQGILQYTNDDTPLYAIYVFDEETNDWADTWKFKMNDDGSVSIEDFYVAAFTWSEAEQIWTNGTLEALYYNVKAKKSDTNDPGKDRLDIYLWGTMTGWDISNEWKFEPYGDNPSVYSFSCPPGDHLVTTDMFLILTEDWSTVLYGLEPGTLSIDLDNLYQLYEGLESMMISLDREWTGICWLDIESGTVVFSNDPNYVAPFANSAVGSIYEENDETEQYYDLRGNKISKDQLSSGIYIVRKGIKSKKIKIK